jgi:hypothetical protein
MGYRIFQNSSHYSGITFAQSLVAINRFLVQPDSYGLLDVSLSRLIYKICGFCFPQVVHSGFSNPRILFDSLQDRE